MIFLEKIENDRLIDTLEQKLAKHFFRSKNRGVTGRLDGCVSLEMRGKKRRWMTGGWYQKVAIPPQARPRQGERGVSESAARCRGEMLAEQGEPRCYGIRTATVP